MDLLYQHGKALYDPHANARTLRLDGIPVATKVPGLPLRTVNGNLVGPTVLDMLVRKQWPFHGLPRATQRAFRSTLPDKAKPPPTVMAWSVRPLEELWPPADQAHKRRRARTERDDRGSRDFDHPFDTALASGGVPVDGDAPHGWVKVRKYSTCQISEHVYRVAAGVYGGLANAYTRIAETAADAWNEDLERALQLWERVQNAPGHVLIEGDDVDKLRPICSVSQQVERSVLREVCTWLGVDPDLSLKRPRGRPAAAEKTVEQGKVIRVALESNGSVTGVFLVDYEGVPAGTELHELKLHVLASILGALRMGALDNDAELLEAWLDAAIPDWRERVADEQEQDSPPTGDDPYEILGVRPDSPMSEITAAFRRAMKRVHPDPSGGLSDWFARKTIDAYKQIQAERGGAGGANESR